MASSRDMFIIERILRDRVGVWRQIADQRDLRRLAGQLLLSTTVSLAVYGAVLGGYNPGWQILASALKLPLLFLVTLVVCLPTLYLFNLVLGARLSVMQALCLVGTCLTVIATIAVGFTPISAFFLLSDSHYGFYKLMNVAILSLSGFVGLAFLVSGMRAMNVLNAPGTAGPPEVRPRSAHMGLLYLWIVVFGLVGTQLGWTLRPVFGTHGEPFALFRHLGENFYVHLFS